MGAAPPTCLECAQAVREGRLLVCPINPIPRRGITPGCQHFIDPQPRLEVDE